MIDQAVHIIEVSTGWFYMRESASISGYIYTQEPLRASWVTPEQAQQVILPQLREKHPGARVIKLVVKFELHSD